MTSSQVLPRLVKETYHYATSSMNLELRADQEMQGVTSLRMAGSKQELVQRPPPLFLLNAYRLFATGRLLAIARTEPFDSSVEDGHLCLRWKPTTQHPVRLEMTYEVMAPATVDVTLTAIAEQDITGYEVFTSSYFDYTLEPSIVVPLRAGQTEFDELRLLKLKGNPFVRGNYILAARDTAALHLRFDGRWNRDDGQPLVYSASGQLYGRPICIMGNTELHVIQLARSEECLNVTTTYADPDPHDGIARHNAAYFGFWGEDLATGEKRTACIRQVLQVGEPTLPDILALHERFLSDTAGNG